MPTSASENYSGAHLEPAYDAESAVFNNGKFASGTYTKGTVLGMVSSTGAYKAYNDSNNDGSQQARAICMYDCYSDGTNVSVTSAGALLPGETRRTAPVWIKGFFKCSDLTGLDAAAVTDLGRLVDAPNTTSGVLAMF